MPHITIPHVTLYCLDYHSHYIAKQVRILCDQYNGEHIEIIKGQVADGAVAIDPHTELQSLGMPMDAIALLIRGCMRLAARQGHKCSIWMGHG